MLCNYAACLLVLPIQDGMWVVPSEYTSAEPDPLRNSAEDLVEEFNSKHAEDVHRIYSIYVESDLQVLISLMTFPQLYFLQVIYCETNENTLLLALTFL